MPKGFYLREDLSIGSWLYHLFIPAPGTGWDEVIGRWAAALFTLAIFSFIFKDNALFKLAEHVFIGVGTGYTICRNFNDAIYDKAYRPLFLPEAGTAPDFWVVIPIILGAMTMLKVIPQWAFWSRWPIAFVAGVTMGLSIITYLQSNVVTQVEATIKPFRFLDEAVRDTTFTLVTPQDLRDVEAKKLKVALEKNGLSKEDEAAIDAELARKVLSRKLVLLDAAGKLTGINEADRSKLLKQLDQSTALAFENQEELPREQLLETIRPRREAVAAEVEKDIANARSLAPPEEKGKTGAGGPPPPELVAERQRLAAKYKDFLEPADSPDAALPVEAQLARSKAVDRVAAARPDIVPATLEIHHRDWMRLANAILIGLGTLAGLVYFFFSKEHTGLVFGGLARVGIWFLMIAFGGSFGFTVMGRISLLIGRIQFLLGDWLHLSGAFSGIVPNF